MSDPPGDVSVLYVDADEQSRSATAEALEREAVEFRVLTAKDPEEALLTLESSRVDCVVSEYELSGDDGVEFLRRVRECHPDLPFVLYTDEGSERVAGEAVAAGTDGYVPRDIEDSTGLLAERISALVSGSADEMEPASSPLSTVVESVSDAIVVVDSDGVVQFANEAVEAILGYDPEDLEGDPLTRFVPPSLRERHREAFDRYLETGERTFSWSDIRFPALHADGYQVPVSVSFGEFDVGGEAEFVGVMRRVGEISDDVLGESSSQFRAIVENLREVVWLEDPESGTVQYVNPAYEEVWGRPRENLYADPDAFIETVHPSDREYVRASRERYENEPVEFEYRIVRPDGDTVWIRDRSVPVRDDGETEFVVSISEDITQTRTLEENLRASEAALADLYRISSDREREFEEKLQRLLETGCEYLGLSLGFLTRIDQEDGTQVIVEGVGDHPGLQPGESCPLSEAYCRRTIESPGLLGVADAVEEGWGDDPAYERFGLGCYLGGKVEVDDELYGTLCFADSEPRDGSFSDSQRTFVELLTRWVSYELERDRTDERLQTKVDRLEQFASVVSHDIRNPLATAHGYLDLVEAGQTEYVSEIEKALTRIDQMTADVLDMAREGESVGETDPVAVHDVAEETWDLYHAERPDANLVVADEMTVEADESALSRMLANLFKNSVEHGGNGVTVTVGDLDQHDGFYVADDGPGIPEEKREAVFEQGYTGGDGTGLGLAIVEELAAGHGWRVDLTESEEGGARFEFRVDGDRDDDKRI